LGSIRRVPSEYTTIQAAIDDANNGDAVLVAPGTYTGDGNRDILFKGKAITVKSEEGPQTCIIDCQGSPEEYHHGFYFGGRRSYNDANSILQGFTIMNGYASSGGGIFCAGDSQRMIECIIKDNAAIEGGGIECALSSNLTLINCIIFNNAATSGGGVSTGGNSQPTFMNCFITGNKATHYGGGASISGGDFYGGDSQPTFINCFITGNNATEGGGISITAVRSQPTFTNCFITGNKAAKDGGGIYSHGIGLSIELLNCTISCNWAGNKGGGFHSDMEYIIGKINNSILYGNIASTGSEIDIFHFPLQSGDGGIVNITHSIVGNDPNAISKSRYVLISGNWLNADPLFIQTGYWDPNNTLDDPNDDFWVDGDYHLKSQAGQWDPASKSWVIDEVTSPCIDAGDPNSPIGDEPFPNGGIINMGAYGGTSEASKSYFGEPPCETIIAGDINGDCKVNLKDFTLFANNWLKDKLN